MIEFIKKFEKSLIFILIMMTAVVLLLATIELDWIILKDMLSPPIFLLGIDELLEISGLFMVVLIGIELLEAIIKPYHVTIDVTPSQRHCCPGPIGWEKVNTF